MRMKTPDFASIEQMLGEHVTARSDAYSLGVVLHLLITGRRPFQPSYQTVDKLVGAINSAGPAKPSDYVGDSRASRDGPWRLEHFPIQE